MDGQNLANLTSVLQASISPVAMISGVGLLILSLTNRLARVMDRLRELLDERRHAVSVGAHVDSQISVLHGRARILKNSITGAVVCVLLAAAIILSLFLMAVFQVRLDLLVMILFASSVLALMASLTLFLLDMDRSLRAVEEELLR